MTTLIRNDLMKFYKKANNVANHTLSRTLRRCLDNGDVLLSIDSTYSLSLSLVSPTSTSYRSQ